MATAAGVAALVGSGAMVSLCDTGVQQVEDDKFKPQYHKNLKDPMTIYARHAIRRQTEEQAKIAQHQQQSHPVEEKPALATASISKEIAGKDATAEQVKHQSDVQTTQLPVPPATLQATSQMVRKSSERQPQNPTAQATSAVDTSLAPVQPPPMTAEEVLMEEKTRKAKQHSGGLKIFSGNGNMSLALEIAKNLGINLGKATVGRFADGEVNVVIHENVRGKDVYVIQPTCMPVNDNLMELLLMVSTLRRASARRITVVIPYYGYARQDRKMQVRYTLWISRTVLLTAIRGLSGPC